MEKDAWNHHVACVLYITIGYMNKTTLSMNIKK